MEVIPFEPWHIAQLKGRLQPRQQDVDCNCTLEFGEILPAKTTWTAVHEGEVLGVAGALPMWAGRAHLWSYLTPDIGRHMVAATRAIRVKLVEMPFRRYEAEVDVEFPEAIRWVRLLGFHNETPDGMQAFFPGGEDAFMYSKVMR